MDTGPANSDCTIWNIVRTLGEGAYGEVKLVMTVENPESAVAMKSIDLVKHPDVVDDVRKEALLMRMLRDHRNVIKYITMRMDENADEFQIFLEYADGGELFDQIEPDVGMPDHKAQFYFRQLIDGIDFVHSKGVAHRDIKPENLLLTKDDVLKISDFGMATVFRYKDRERLLETRCGTLPYVSPEILIPVAKYRAEAADLWSCGIVLVTLLAGELAWDSPTSECTAFKDWVENANILDTHPWSKIGTVALALLRAILNADVQHRANIYRIRRHPWFCQDVSRHSRGPDPIGGEHGSPRMSRKKRCLHTVMELSVHSSDSTDDQWTSQPIPDCPPAAYRSISRQTDRQTVPLVSSCTNAGYSASTSHLLNVSFSQPEDLEAMLLNHSQIHSQPVQCGLV